jgi:hypothetical protein
LVIGEVGGKLLEHFDFDYWDMVVELEESKFKGPFGYKYFNHECTAVLPLLSSLCIQDWHRSQMIPVDRILSFFAQCPLLTSISVTNCEGVKEDVLLQLTGTLESPFCAQLQTIHFDGNYHDYRGTPERVICEVGDAFMVQIGSNCPNLTSLSVHCHSERLTNVGLQRLARCKKLSVLQLHGKEDFGVEQAVTDAGLSHLADCRDLTSVFLKRFDRFTDHGVSQFTKDLPKLTSLELEGCLLLKGALTSTLPQLKSFSLVMRDQNLASLSASEMCPKLTSLEVHSLGGFVEER